MIPVSFPRRTEWEYERWDEIVDVVTQKHNGKKEGIVCWPKIYAPMSRFLELIIGNPFNNLTFEGEVW